MLDKKTVRVKKAFNHDEVKDASLRRNLRATCESNGSVKWLGGEGSRLGWVSIP